MRTTYVLIILALLAAPIFASNATVAYTNNSASNIPYVRFWDSSGAGSWGSEITLASAGSPPRWERFKYSPISQKMLLVTLSDDGWLDAYVCLSNCQTAASWVVTNQIGAVGATPTQRRFDIAFETATGDALVVYEVNSTNNAQDLAYKVLPVNETSFSGISEQYIDDSGAAAVVYGWVKMDSDPVASSQEIIMAGYDTSGNDILAWVWNGSAWGNEQAVTSTSNSATPECLDVAYSESGDQGIVVGVSSTNGAVNYQNWSGTAWGASTLIADFAAGTADVFFIHLSPDPATNDMIMMLTETSGTGILNASFWTGNGWRPLVTPDTGIDGTTTTRAFDFAWNLTGSIGYLVWDTDTTGSTLSYRNWSTSTNWSATGTVSSYTGTGAWLSLATNPTASDTVDILGIRMNSTFPIGSFNRNSANNYNNYGDRIISGTATAITFEAFSLDFLKAYDSTGPSVGNTSSNASTVPTNSIICVNATATDAAGGISQVKAQIRVPNGTYYNITLSDTGCNAGAADDGWWGAEVNVSNTTGTLTINTTFANDSFNNAGFQSPFPNVAVTVQQAATPPSVGNTSVNATSVYANVSICVNATASDADGISAVWTEVRYPDGTYANVTMSDTGCNAGGGGDNRYGIAINVGSLSGNFFVNNTYANDTLGALGNHTANLQVTVQAPSVGNTSVNASTVYTSIPICVNATVTDTSGVSAVWTQVRFPNGSYQNITMSDTGCNAGGGGDGIWGISINVSSTAGNFTVNTTFANDSFNNIGYQSPFPNLLVDVQPQPPTHETPILNSTLGTNTTDENLTCYNQSTLFSTANTFDWRENGTSTTTLILPFDVNVSSTGAGLLRDYSTFGHNGTVGNGTAGTAPVWNATGRVGGAYKYDGINDEIRVPHNSNLTGNGDWLEITAMAWVNPSNSTATGIFMNKRWNGSTGSNASIQFGFDGTQVGKPFCVIYFSGTPTYAEALAAYVPTALGANTWHLVTCTYKNGTGVQVYVNSTLVTSNYTYGGFVRQSTNIPLQIGARQLNGVVERWFNGSIDEVRIFRNRSLSAEEIANYYNLGHNVLVSQELYSGTNYTCAVTPTNSATDGATKISNSLIVTPGTPPINYDDVFFNSSFQSGNLYNVAFVSGDASGNRTYSATMNYSTIVNPYHHWWFFFKMTNASGKNVKINITNPTTEDFTGERWQNLRPRFSYDFGQGNIDADSSDWGAGNWSALSPASILYSQASLWFSFNISATQDTVWVASNVPYTVLRRDRFLSSIAASPYVTITNLGTTTFGFNLSAVEVTDTAYTASAKTKAYLVGQAHANVESQGSWEIEGAINFLLNATNSTAATMRQNYRFRFIPIINVDAVYNGTGHYTAVYDGTTQWEPNNLWDDAREGNETYNTVNWTYADIGTFAPNASIDLHGSINGESGIGIPPGVNYFQICNTSEGSIMAPFLSNISAVVPYIWSDMTQLSGVQTMSKNVFLGHNVYPSLTFEISVTNVTSTLVPNYTDYVTWGSGVLLGIHGYYNTTGNTIAPLNVSFASPVNNTIYNASSVLISISSSGATNVWFFNETANETYTAPITRNFSNGNHSIVAYANNSTGHMVSYNVTFRMAYNISVNNTAVNATEVLPNTIVCVNATASDPAGISAVWTEVRFPNGTYANFTMSPTGCNAGSAGDAWYGVAINVSNTTGQFFVNTTYANDTLGNNGSQSANLLVSVQAQVPIQSTPILNSTLGTNTTSENLTCYNQSTQYALTSIFDFRENGTSRTSLNLAFDLNISSNNTGLLRDYSTFGHNGTLGNGSAGTWPVWNASGRIGGAYTFDGVNDRIVVPHNSNLSGNGDWTKITIMAWVNPTTASATGLVVSKRWNSTSNGNSSFLLGFDSTQVGKPFCLLYFTSAPTSVEALASNVPNALGANTWHLITCTYNPTTGIEVYVNATRVTNNSVIGGGPIRHSTNIPVLIGARGNATGTVWTPERFFNGSIDEVRIFANRSLSQAEIANYYALGHNMVLANELLNYTNYTCAVTPADNETDGTTLVSNAVYVQPPPPLNVSFASPVNNTIYNSTSILISISSTSATSVWFYNETANETYTAPIYRNFSSGVHTLIAYANNSTGHQVSSTVTFNVSYNDVFFNSSFQSGNLYNVQFVSGDANGNRVYNATINYSTFTDLQYHWWFFFKMTNASGKNIKVNITNPLTLDFSNDRWPHVRPRFSYDFGQGNVDNASSDWSMGNWSGVASDSIVYSSGSLWFSFNISATQDTVWVAPMIPYTVLRRDLFLSTIVNDSYVNISNVATSYFGLNVSAVVINDTSYNGANKKRIYIIGQQHANEESQGSWEIEGAINFLLNRTNLTARTLMRNYVFKFVPIVNVDGVYNGSGRFSPHYNNSGQSVLWDPNREWDNARTNNVTNTSGVINATYWNIGAFLPNATLDLHGSMNGEQPTIPPDINYFLIDKAADTTTNGFAGNLSAHVPYVFSTWNVVTNSQSMPVNIYTGWNVHPSFTFEFTASNVTATLIPNQTHWMSWGTEILEGIHGFYNNTANGLPDTTPPNVSLNLPLNATSTSSTSFNFSCNVTDNIAVRNITLYIWNTTGLWNNSNVSNPSGSNGTFNFSVSSFAVGFYNWNCLAYDNESNSAWAPANFTLNITSGVSSLNCTSLSTAGTIYNLTANASTASGTCFNVTAQNVTLECAGYSISGANDSNSYGMYSSQQNTTVKNCKIENFAEAIRFDRAASGSVSNNTLTTTFTGGVGIRMTSGSNYTNISANTITTANATGILIDGGANVSVDCVGRTISGTSLAGSIGIFSTQFNTTIKNCNVQLFDTGIYFNSLNGTVSTSNVTNSTNRGIMLQQSNFTSITSTYACFNQLDVENNGSSNAGASNTCDSFISWSEDSRSGCTFACTSLWHRFFGNLSGTIVLGHSNVTPYVYNWSSSTGLNVYFTDYDSTINWQQLQAIGKNTTNHTTGDDFLKLDSAFGTGAFRDSINYTYSTNGSNPRLTDNFTIYGRTVDYVPIANSSPYNTAFTTGILWDMGGGGTSYSNDTKQSVVWAVKANSSSSDAYGTYDYLAQVPYTLKTYQAGNDLVAIYAELQ